jgi:uncharacterized protein (TIRG00374 family)
MAWLLSRIPGDQVADSLRRADRAGLALAALVMLTSNLLGAWQWGRLLGAVDIRIPAWKTAAYYHVGLFFNNFLPANIGGDIARTMDAARHGSGRAAALSAVVMDRLLGTLALAGIALVTTLPAIDHYRLGIVYLSLVGFFTASVVATWVVLHPSVLPALARLLGRVGLERLAQPVAVVVEQLGAFRGRTRLLVSTLALAIVVQLSRIGVHVAVARALDLQVPLPYFLLFVPLLAVIVSLPISFNGIGVRESAGVVLFGLVGLGQAAAFSLQFTTYLVAVAVSLLGGVVFLVRLPRRRAERRELRRLS